MPDVVIASTEADAKAAHAVEQHHAAMAGALALRTESLLLAASRSDALAAERARLDLVHWCETELLPHARAEEEALYPEAQRTEAGRLLVEGMLGEHEVIGRLLSEVSGAVTDPVRAGAAARALQAVFESHLAKENELVVPLLHSTPGVSVAALLGGMHQLLGGADEPAGHGESTSSGCGGHTCTCGETDPVGAPEVDARSIPHAIRHATIFGALESVVPGAGLVLAAPHDPLPLLAQIEQRWPGGFSVEYVERGPDTWRLLFVRAA